MADCSLGGLLMPRDISKIPLLTQLRDLKRRRRFSASIITTYTINFPFYEDVVLRYLLGTGSRLNIVLADAGEIAKAFSAESSRPRSAGLDYLLLPISTSGAFHPKILSLFSDKGMAIAIGSHNLTEAGFGRNNELSATLGFSETAAPSNIAKPVVEYLLKCADQLAKGDATLSARLADRLRSLSLRNNNTDAEIAFSAAIPSGTSLLSLAFQPSELEKADRILILGPYFDAELSFIAALCKQARKAEVVVAIQPEHAVIKQIDRWPTKTRICNANALNIRKGEAFTHAKVVVIEMGNELLLALGSANPSAPAWLDKGSRRNFEAMVVLRGRKALAAFRDLGLAALWNAPTVTKTQLNEISTRSRLIGEPEPLRNAPVAGLWKNGWVESKLASSSKRVRSIRQFGSSVDLPIDLAKIENDVLRFSSPTAGMFLVEFSDKPGSNIVIASSAAVLAPSLVSGTTERLIDELGRLDGGSAPGDELLDLCEKVLLQPESPDEAPKKRGSALRSTNSDANSSQHELNGPRGISIEQKPLSSRSQVTLGLDISAIITLLLNDLHLPFKDADDPNADQADEIEDGDEPDDEDLTRKTDDRQRRNWNDVVNAIRPRITRLLRQLEKRLVEDRSAKWKYERVLLTLALLKRLRKFGPGQLIPTSGRPARLVDDAQVRQAFKIAMRCCFSRDVGIVGALERAGGVETEHDVVGRALLLWAAYEAGTDAAEPTSLSVGPEKLRAIQADRTDALIAAIAASASASVLSRAQRELFDRGEWQEPRDRRERIGMWFQRHRKIGEAFQKRFSEKRPISLPVTIANPSIHDIVVWKAEPGWPRLPQLVSGKVIHLADVGDAVPLKISQQFIQAVDTKVLGLTSLLN
jgi:hypothetical protein